MTDQNANPSVDPADTASMSGMLRFVFKKLLQNVDGMLPAVVVAVTPDRNYATVKPLIMVQGTDGSLTPRPQYAKVAVGAAGAGNFVMSFPITPGDLGWIEASDRDISLFLQGDAEAGPNTNRLHSFEDGVFWPDKARQWALSDADAVKAVWQSLDGSIKITLGADMITLQHPTAVLIDTPLTTFTGAVLAALTITSAVDVVSDTISGKTHAHGGVTPGPGDTGPPV